MLKLSTKARYALRAMIELALHEGEGSLQLKEIARAQQISQKYLEQLTIPLRNAGLIQSERGPSGGYELSRPAEAISALTIVQAVEGPLDIMDCLSKPSECERNDSCAARKLWSKVNRAINSSLAETSLAELRDSQRAAMDSQTICYQI